ncbi:hypothetical protein SAMN05421665_1805 [Yoonia rosea]|uniref:Uncharacterized protein n=1 Tax=Yoonia rosea TaxID=287098 RepID=A0A1R3X419_9RHOB|nr:hypothetical protein [Yoonia rosea]SIT84166.1 hypothetical protein SAMN05421665_1805 [Yoonia rosea]
MAHDEDIDDLVSSVRDFVSHKEPQRSRSRILLDRLILTPDLRVDGGNLPESPTNAARNGATSHVGVRNLPPVKTYDKAGLEATIAELEAAVTAQFDDWEADEGECFAKAAWAASAFQKPQNDSLQVTDPEPPFVHSERQTDAVAPQSSQPAMTSEAAVEATKDAVVASVLSGLDDKALRRLVAEIVHEELGGELGERITRNVRKLVRREINRVLTSREMDQG